MFLQVFGVSFWGGGGGGVDQTPESPLDLPQIFLL